MLKRSSDKIETMPNKMDNLRFFCASVMWVVKVNGLIQNDSASVPAAQTNHRKTRYGQITNASSGKLAKIMKR